MRNVNVKIYFIYLFIYLFIYFLNTVNGIIVILVEIFKTNGFYGRKYLMIRYSLANCKKKKRNK